MTCSKLYVTKEQKDKNQRTKKDKNQRTKGERKFRFIFAVIICK